MFDELFSQYLRSVFSADYVDILNSCREALVNYGYSLCEANLYRCMPEETNITVHESKLAIERCLRDGFRDVFLTLGIRTDIQELYKLDQLLRAIRNLETSSQHATILDIILNDEYSQSETLEKLLELVSIDGSIANMIFNITVIGGNALFNRLHDHHLYAYRSQDGEATDDRPDKAYFDRIQAFVIKYPSSLVARKLANKDILFGETIQHYIAENTDELTALYPNHVERCPEEFAGLAIFANVPRHELSGLIKTSISKFYNDLRFTTKTNYLVDKFIEELEYEHKPTSMVQAGD